MSVIVTGAAQGIGAEITRQLATRGARVIAADLQAEKAASVAASLSKNGEVEVVAEFVDISRPDSAAALVDHARKAFGRVDALVNNAGLDAPPLTALEVDEEHWSRVIDVNLSGAWWCTQAVLPAMCEQGFGKIVFISSLAARIGSARYSPAYAASKAGLIGLTVGLAAQVEQYGIRVNAITPGATGNTGTPMLDEERDELLNAHPLGVKGATPIADAVCYLLDSSGDWISGTVLNVSGGQLHGI
jgi:NAD(P)-dependent dehydrogenase (short-subunit alcohol dehydrogenase family)